MEKYQLVQIEVEVALHKIIKMGLDITDIYTRGKPLKKDAKVEKSESILGREIFQQHKFLLTTFS